MASPIIRRFITGESVASLVSFLVDIQDLFQLYIIKINYLVNAVLSYVTFICFLQARKATDYI